jgi:hypothetical protein
MDLFKSLFLNSLILVIAFSSATRSSSFEGSNLLLELKPRAVFINYLRFILFSLKNQKKQLQEDMRELDNDIDIKFLDKMQNRLDLSVAVYVTVLDSWRSQRGLQRKTSHRSQLGPHSTLLESKRDLQRVSERLYGNGLISDAQFHATSKDLLDAVLDQKKLYEKDRVLWSEINYELQEAYKKIEIRICKLKKILKKLEAAEEAALVRSRSKE